MSWMKQEQDLSFVRPSVWSIFFILISCLFFFPLSLLTHSPSLNFIQTFILNVCQATDWFIRLGWLKMNQHHPPAIGWMDCVDVRAHTCTGAYVLYLYRNVYFRITPLANVLFHASLMHIGEGPTL